MEFGLKDKSPLDYARLGCEAIMKKYTPDKLPPERTLFYHQGVFLSGMMRLYKLTGEDKYFNYIKEYIDSAIGTSGEVYGIDHEVTDWVPEPTWGEGIKQRSLTMLDCKQPVILMYELYDKTGDEKYLKAIKKISESMYFWPVNNYGGYWHMMHECDQMWLDGAYMVGPLSVMYSERFKDPRLRDRAIKQILIMDEHMKDVKTGLYYHGWDASRKQKWADKETGLSSQIWGRALGWYAVAILDMLDYIPKNHPDIERLKRIEAELLNSLAKYQDIKTGMWFEVLDKPEKQDNWVESSCTCLFIYSYAKAIEKGIISKDEYAHILEKAYKGLIESIYYDDEGTLTIDNICGGTCIEKGTYEHYINREKIKNDLHGVGAFVLMCSEMQNYLSMSKPKEARGNDYRLKRCEMIC